MKEIFKKYEIKCITLKSCTLNVKSASILIRKPNTLSENKTKQKTQIFFKPFNLFSVLFIYLLNLIRDWSESF